MDAISGSKLLIDVTAYHEAGHALAALYEGRRVSGVCVLRNKPGNGVCFHARNERNPFNLGINSGTAQAAWDRTLKTALSDIRILLAGPIAEAKALHKPLRSLGAKSDLDKCLHIAEKLSIFHDYVTEYVKIQPIDAVNLLNEQRTRTRKWVAHPKVWKLTTHMAYALAAKGHLIHQDLDFIIGSKNTHRSQISFDFRYNNKDYSGSK